MVIKLIYVAFGATQKMDQKTRKIVEFIFSEFLSINKMTKPCRLLQIVVIQLIFFGIVVSAGADKTANILKRTSDPVVLSASAFPVTSMPIEHLNLYALKDGKKKAIPFQIDERTKKGKYIFPFGRKSNLRESNGIFSEKDELVFMIRDAGDKANPGLFSESKSIIELELTDPVDNSQRWVYLVEATCKPTDLSKEDYVNYDASAKIIDAKYYSFGFDPEFTTGITKVIIKPCIGGSGKNWFDRTKIRVDIKTRFGFSIKKNEDDFVSEDLAFIDGPVRVFRRTATQVKLWWKLKSPSGIIDNIFYFDHFCYPMDINMPISPSVIFEEGYFRFSTGFISNTINENIIYFNSNNPDKVYFNGKMSEAEKALDMNLYEWAVNLGDHGKGPGMFTRLELMETTRNLKIDLYYMDDLSIMDAPEREPGHFGNSGFIFRDFSNVQRGKYKVEMSLFVIPGFKLGDENNYLNITDNRIQCKIKAYNKL